MQKEVARVVAAPEGAEALEGENVGHIWGIPFLRDYCRARVFLADKFLYMAHMEEVEHIYQKGLGNYLELLRLIHRDNMGLRDKVPFTLLNLNREDDAYNFLKWWITIDSNGIYDWSKVPQNTKEGDWLWLRGQNRYEDPKSVLNSEATSASLAHVTAMFIIKARIIAKYHDLKILAVIEQFVIEIGGIEMSHLLLKIKCMFYGVSENVLQAQYDHAKYLLQVIAKKNVIFLKSVLNPGPLKDQGFPGFVRKGTAEETFLVLNNSCRMFHRIPGCISMVKKFVGTDTSYDPGYGY